MDYIKLFVSWKNPSYAIDAIFFFDFLWRKRISHLNIPLIIRHDPWSWEEPQTCYKADKPAKQKGLEGYILGHWLPY
jgi:hypothetical protein